MMIPDDDVLLDYTVKSIAGIPEKLKRFEPIKYPKALIHTWLAWQAEPGKPFGQSLKANYLDAHDPRITPFIQWLRDMFFSVQDSTEGHQKP